MTPFASSAKYRPKLLPTGLSLGFPWLDDLCCREINLFFEFIDPTFSYFCNSPTKTSSYQWPSCAHRSSSWRTSCHKYRCKCSRPLFSSPGRSQVRGNSNPTRWLCSTRSSSLLDSRKAPGKLHYICVQTNDIEKPVKHSHLLSYSDSSIHNLYPDRRVFCSVCKWLLQMTGWTWFYACWENNSPTRSPQIGCLSLATWVKRGIMAPSKELDRRRDLGDLEHHQ